jgi:hemolysin D
VDGRRIEFAPGMNVTVEIQIGQRRVLEYVLAPLLRYTAESLRER